MKPKHYWSNEFNLEEQIINKTKNFKAELAQLEVEDKLNKRIKKMNFPCEVRYSIIIGTDWRLIEFHAPSGGWKDDKNFHLTLTKLVRIFKVRFERKFEETTGNYHWEGQNKKGLKIRLFDAVKPENCVVVPFQETVTRYKSICGEEKNKLEVKDNG